MGNQPGGLLYYLTREPIGYLPAPYFPLHRGRNVWSPDRERRFTAWLRVGNLATFLGAMALNSPQQAASIGIVGGADGPTAPS